MLQQILKDMWVDPEILEGLDETQKQTLFCKMREEQVRRWKEWDSKIVIEKTPTINNKSTNKKVKKTVNFLEGTNGEPWVWVMGEHPDDKSIEQILEEEAREKARKLVEDLTITQKVINLNEENIKEIQPINIPIKEEKMKIQDTLDIYCSVEELMAEKVKLKPLKNIDYTINHYKTENIYHKDNRDILQEISLNKTQKVSQKVAMWEKKMMEERIFNKIKKKRLEVAKEAEEAEYKQEELWREQERRAKQAEQKIREIARKAREEHRLASEKDTEVDKNVYSHPDTSQPTSRKAVLDWYRQREIGRQAGIDQYNNIEPWFHGLITRQEAEEILTNQESGSFLVRLSEKIWGYTITYRSTDGKCKHYLIDAINGYYQFRGQNQINHNTLADLITYHRTHPLSGGECLIQACPRKSDSPALTEMLSVLAS